MICLDIQDTKFAESVVALAKLLRVPSDEIHDPMVTLQVCFSIHLYISIFHFDFIFILYA